MAALQWALVLVALLCFDGGAAAARTAADTNQLWATIHIGPMKTATTTIQKALLENTTLQRIAVAEDRVDVPFSGARRGERMESLFPNARREGALRHIGLAAALATFNHTHGLRRLHIHRQEWASFQKQVDGARRGLRHLLLSSESFGRTFVPPKPLLAALRPAYHAHVVLVYRPFFEWVLSMYGQQYRTDGHSLAVPREFGAAAQRHVPFVTWISSAAGRERISTHSIWGVHERWAKAAARGAGGSVSVLSFRSASGPLLQRFVCGHMHAPHACSWLKHEADGQWLAAQIAHRGQSSVRSAVGDIVFAAAQRGIMRAAPMDLAMREIVDTAVHAFHKGMVRAETGARLELPLTCLPDAELQWIWEWSLRQERRFAPDSPPEQLRAEFDESRREMAFCSGDANVALLSGGSGWAAALRTLFPMATFPGMVATRQSPP